MSTESFVSTVHRPVRSEPRPGRARLRRRTLGGETLDLAVYSVACGIEHFRDARYLRRVRRLGAQVHR